MDKPYKPTMSAPDDIAVPVRETDLRYVSGRLAQAASDVSEAADAIIKMTDVLVRPGPEKDMDNTAIKDPEERCALANDLLESIRIVERVVYRLKHRVKQIEL